MGWLGVFAALTVPMLLSGLDRSRGLAAARYLASRMALARAYAIGRSANVAIRFEDGGRGLRFAMFADGNGNGVRTVDIDAGVDVPVEPWVVLSEQFPGVGTTAGPDLGEAVHVGTSRLLSFSPDGTATAGTVYIASSDGSRWAVRVLGTTARTRVLRQEASSGAWVQAF